jgi:hypothetical protein
MLRTHRVSDLFEATEAEDFQRDEATGQVRAVHTLIKAGRSKNNREYREAALRTAVSKGMYNGLRMFMDHDRTKLPTQRSVRELVAGVEEAWYDEPTKSVKGKVLYIDREFAEKMSTGHQFMGNSMSQVVRGERRKDPVTGKMFEDISEIISPRSCDFVVFPAAGGGLEGFVQEGDDEVDWTSLTIEELEANLPPALAEEFLKKHNTLEAATCPDCGGTADAANGNCANPMHKKTAAPPVAAESLTKEAVAGLIQEGIQSYINHQSSVVAEREKIATHISKAGLPKLTAERLIRTFSAAESFDQAAVDKIIEQTREELKAAGAGPRLSGFGPSGSSDPAPAPQVISAHEAVESFFGTKPASKDGK